MGNVTGAVSNQTNTQEQLASAVPLRLCQGFKGREKTSRPRMGGKMEKISHKGALSGVTQPRLAWPVSYARGRAGPAALGRGVALFPVPLRWG